MGTCKVFSEELAFINELSSDRRQEILQHTENCDRCRKRLRQFEKIMSSLPHNPEKAQHPFDEEVLLRFSIHRESHGEPDYDGTTFSSSELDSIQSHIEDCPECAQKVQNFTKEYRDLETYFEHTDLPDLTLGEVTPAVADTQEKRQLFGNIIESVQSLADQIKERFWIPIPGQLQLATIAVAAVLVILWFGPFYRIDNPYLPLASFENESPSFVTRGEGPNLFTGGFIAFHEGNYEQAIIMLEEAIAANPENNSVFFAHYLTGLSYLFSAKKEVLGRFERLDRRMVQKGIGSLQAAYEGTDDLRTREDCLWYTGKAFLMLDEPEQAKTTFTEVVDLNARRFRSARRMVEEIDNITSGN
jgi:tetratricopeptide (TPR) repeat protein